MSLGGAIVVAALLGTTACAPAEPTASVSASPSASSTPTPGAPALDDTYDGDGPLTAAPLETEEAEIGETVEFSTGVAVVIDSVEVVEITAETPGETDGSAVVVTVTASNDSTESQKVDSAVVTVVADDDGEPGIGTTAGEPSPLSGTIEPGQSATGKYVFMLDPVNDRSITVSVNYAAGEPVAVFTGKVS